LNIIALNAKTTKEPVDDWIKQGDGSTMASDVLRLKIANHSSSLNESDTEDEQNSAIDEIMRNDIIDSDSEDVDTDHEEPLNILVFILLKKCR